jgi:biopolymer transport protein ExbD
MLHARRHDHSPRVELLPLIDVIFLLLTFFIYSLILTVRADILPVQLVPVGGGQQAEPGRAAALTVDADGQLYFDREPIDLDALPARLEAFAAAPDRPPLFLALEDDGRTDRGPLLVKLIGLLRDVGITDVSVVGPPAGDTASPQ